jgi:hypothetical protein
MTQDFEMNGVPVAAWDYQPEPDVWWGADGIDSMAWADGIPYGELVEDSEARPEMAEATP